MSDLTDQNLRDAGFDPASKWWESECSFRYTNGVTMNVSALFNGLLNLLKRFFSLWLPPTTESIEEKIEYVDGQAFVENMPLDHYLEIKEEDKMIERYAVIAFAILFFTMVRRLMKKCNPSKQLA